MSTTPDLLSLALSCHVALPERIRSYLNDRGIPDASIDYHMLGWNGSRITIPILNRAGEIVFFKLVRDPADSPLAPKMLTWPKGHAELFGWGNLFQKQSRIVICEGEFDQLVLETHHIPAVTSTGGAGTFRSDWTKYFVGIPDIYICFDNDAAGRNGAIRVASMIPRAKIVTFPPEVGEGGDVTDFFVRLGRSRDDFVELLRQAQPAPPESPESDSSLADDRALFFSERASRLRRKHSIARVIGHYVKLTMSGGNLVGRCPFHPDRHPSLVVYTATDTYYCFGCRRYGDAITFLRDIENITFTQALDALDHFTLQHGPEPENDR